MAQTSAPSEPNPSSTTMDTEEWGERVEDFKQSRQSKSGSGQFRKSTEEHLEMKAEEFEDSECEGVENGKREEMEE